MKRRLLSISLAICMIFSILPMTALAAEDTYSDTAGYWAEAAIERWSGYGVLQGNGGLFRPDDPITRAELAAVLDRVMKYQEKSDIADFSDVDASAWYAPAVLKLNAAGVMLGSGGKLRPNNSITREEAAVMIGRAFAVPENSGNENPFPDAGDISGWASFLVDGMKAAGYISGYSDGNFGPKNTITRAEVVTILNKMVDSFYYEAGEYDSAGISFSPKNVVINTDGVTLKNTTITGDLFITAGVGSGTVTLGNVTVTGTTYIWGGGPDSVIATGCDFNAIRLNAATNPALKLSTETKAIQVYLDNTGTVTHDGVTVKYDAATDAITFGGTIDKVTLNVDGTATLSIGGIVYDVIPPEGTVAKFELAKDAVVKNMVVNAPVDVTGSGKIEKMEVHSNDVVIDKSVGIKPENITVDKDIKVDIGDKEYTGEGGNLPAETTLSSSGGGGGGGGSTVYVTGISLDRNTAAITVGGTQQLTATVAPNNATNKNVAWTSSDTGVATVSASGLMSAVSAGTATITATTANGSKTATCAVTVTNVTVAPVNVACDISAFVSQTGHKADATVTLSADFGDYSGVDVNCFLISLPSGATVPAGWTAETDAGLLAASGMSGTVYRADAGAAGEYTFTFTVPEHFPGGDITLKAGAYEQNISPIVYEFSAQVVKPAPTTGAINFAPTVDHAENFAPIAGLPVTGHLTFSDPDGDAVSVVSITFNGTIYTVDPAGTTVSGNFGTLTVYPDGAYSYTRTQPMTASDRDVFSITVRDSRGAWASSNLTIRRGGGIDTFEINTTVGSVSVSYSGDVGQKTQFGFFFIDPKGENFTITLTGEDGIPFALSFNVDGSLASGGSFDTEFGMVTITGSSRDASGKVTVTYEYTLTSLSKSANKDYIRLTVTDSENVSKTVDCYVFLLD